MSIVISQQSLLPIRRDKQIISSISFGVGGGSSGGGGTTYTGGINICLNTGGTTTTINVCGVVGIACNACNALCLGGYCSTCFINCQPNCLCVAHSSTSNTATNANYANTAGSTTGGVMGAQDGTYNCYLTKWCANSCITFSRYYDNGTCACLNGCLSVGCLIGNVCGNVTGSAGSTNNSTCLNGQLSSYYAPISNPVFTGSYVCAPDVIITSDCRLKTFIQPIYNTSSNSIEYKEFQFCNNIGQVFYGVIAQDLVHQYPELVSVGVDGIMGVRYESLFAYEINALKAEIKALKLQVNNMRYEINSGL
jgi:hypothetical protein